MAVGFPDLMHPVDSVELEINQLFDRLTMCLQQRRRALLTTYRNARDKIVSRPTEQARKELIGLKTETETRLLMNELRELQEKLLVEIEQKLIEVRAPQPETQIEFRGNCGHLEQVIEALGEVIEVEVPVVPRYGEMRPIVAVGKKGKAPGDLWNPNGVAIDGKTNLIYVAEGSDFCRISIFSESGAFINAFSHEDMTEPYGIAIHRDSLYVTDREAHTVFKFKIEADMRLVAKLGCEGSGMGQFSYPYGLTVSTNGDVFVADSNNNRIQILDDSLHFQTLITHQTLELPLDVKLTPDEVYVLGNASLCIVVFSRAGEKIRSLITQGMGMQIALAEFFCLDRKQNLLISEWENSQVRIFSNEGTHLHTIGTRGHEIGMLFYPQGIVLTKNLKLIIVSNNNNYRLQIYSSQ